MFGVLVLDSNFMQFLCNKGNVTKRFFDSSSKKITYQERFFSKDNKTDCL